MLVTITTPSSSAASWLGVSRRQWTGGRGHGPDYRDGRSERQLSRDVTGHARPFGVAMIAIGGKLFGEAAGLGSCDVIDPANQAVVGRAPVADDATVDAAVSSAAQAFGPWAALPATARPSTSPR